jgi:hypothetical protein
MTFTTIEMEIHPEPCKEIAANGPSHVNVSFRADEKLPTEKDAKSQDQLITLERTNLAARSIQRG